MKFEHNPYYSPDLCGLSILYEINTGESYEYDMLVIWKKNDDGTIWWDTDSGCSCPSPFDNADNGHDLTQITSDTMWNFEQALENHYRIEESDILEAKRVVGQHMNGQ